MTLTPRIPALGGAVKIEGLQPPAALVRLEGEESGPVEVPAETESVLVPSLLPGTYAVLLCADAGCEEPLERWNGVEVRRGETVVLERHVPEGAQRMR